MISKARLITVFWILNFFICSAHAVKREVVVECGLPDQSKFIFTSRYEWSPLAKLARHVSERSNQEDFTAVYNGTKWKSNKNFDDLFIYARYQNTPKSLCAFTGMFQGVPYGFTNEVSVTILFPQTGRFEVVKLPRTFRIDFDSEDAPNALRISVADLSVKKPLQPFFRAGFIKNTLILEQALVANKRPCNSDADECEPAVKAVQHVESNDGGITWTTPIISIQPKLFLVNKSINEQIGIGRVLKVNGKPFQEAP